ncbi:hypothetical protein DFJ77DRAFT_432830 [Powellomyces hirtus]|nr:hypothetical protein DFJ77DRAFT_432830 [Powellomyces hirtus]
MANPVLEQCVKLANGLVDIGKSMPFVAPIFTILKVIIDVEQKARDAASKCDDLIERINFMVSHLLVLKNVHVYETVELVVQRMEKVLKDAAALITAYRKQGKIARRLNMSNKENFITAGEEIQAVTGDLMLSLQIQQTGQLDVLTKAFPKDPEDDAAEAFLKAHGGEEAVKHNEELVRQFAAQTHLTMDDSVMEELNLNLSDMMREQKDQIEALLRENVTAAVMEGIKGFAGELAQAEDAREREEKKTCVQCGNEYRESVNVATSCSFHKAESPSNSRTGTYPCCGDALPCQRRQHRAKHHNDYPYGPFFTRARNILNYTDCVDWDIDITEPNLDEGGNDQVIGVGRLLKWQSGTPRIKEPILAVRIGIIRYTGKFFFGTFDPNDIIDLNLAGAPSFIAKVDDDDNGSFAMAEWMLGTDGLIKGVRLTAKVSSSLWPTVKEVLIDVDDTMERIGEVRTVSEGGLKPYKPIGNYRLPEPIRAGGTLKMPSRKVRKDFKTVSTSADLSVIITPKSDPPIEANPNFANGHSDTFVGTVSVFNKHKSEALTILSAKAVWRLVGDTDWKECKSFKVEEFITMPINISSRETGLLSFHCVVPRSEEDTKDDVNWWNRAYIARHRPLRLRLTLTDVEGEECSTTLEYFYTPVRVPQEKSEDDAAFFFFDHVRGVTRNHVSFKTNTSRDEVFALPNKAYTVDDLNRIVYKAQKTGVTEIDLEINHKLLSPEGSFWNAWALVDLSCMRVYAIKVLLRQNKEDKHQTMFCLGYASVPDYGDAVESRPIQYAMEFVGAPEVVEDEYDPYLEEDGLDDVVPETPKPLPSDDKQNVAGTGSMMSLNGPVTLAFPETLNEHFKSNIDRNLERMADAVEALVGVLGGMAANTNSVDSLVKIVSRLADKNV